MLVAQSCPTLCDPMDCSLPGSSVQGILQARRLECVAISLSGDLLIEGLNPGLLHCRQILYHLSHQGSPNLVVDDDREGLRVRGLGGPQVVPEYDG